MNRKKAWSNLKYCHRVSLKGLRKNKRNLGYGSKFQVGFEPETPKWEDALPLCQLAPKYFTEERKIVAVSGPTRS
jgi:hypothetical protein